LSRRKTIKLGILNIKSHPHSALTYSKIFMSAFELKQSIKIYGESYGRLGYCSYINKNAPEEGVLGWIYKFTDINLLESWYNVDKDEEATDDEIKKLNIPKNLKPNFTKYFFVFFSPKHRLFVETQNSTDRISVHSVKNLFSSLLNHPALLEKYPMVDVFIEQSRDQLDYILELPLLKKLFISVTLPNADDLESEEAEIFRRLNSENASKLELSYTASSGKSIMPNEGTKKMARVAVSNGYVVGSGIDESDKSVTESTKDHPLIESFKHNPSEVFERSFMAKARELLNAIF
jgi:hypothetical protein